MLQPTAQVASKVDVQNMSSCWLFFNESPIRLRIERIEHAFALAQQADFVLLTEDHASKANDFARFNDGALLLAR